MRLIEKVDWVTRSARSSTDREAPVRSIMALLGDRWTTLKLRTLERDGFVAREVTGDVPPRVSYRLTPLSQALHDQARGMIDWIKSVTKQIETARRQFDQD